MAGQPLPVLQVHIERSAIGRYPGLLGAGTVAFDRLFYGDQPPVPARSSSWE